MESLSAWAIPLAALIVAVGTMLMTRRDLTRVARNETVELLSQQLTAMRAEVNEMRDRIAKCEEARDTLMRERAVLLERLVRRE